MRNNGVGSWIARRARRTPERVAVMHGEDVATYAQLDDRVTRLAHGLRGLGVRRGDRVAYLGPNHPAFLETLFAAGTLGAILVPLNTRLAVPELAGHLSGSLPRVLIYGPAQAVAVAELRAGPEYPTSSRCQVPQGRRTAGTATRNCWPGERTGRSTSRSAWTTRS